MITRDTRENPTAPTKHTIFTKYTKTAQISRNFDVAKTRLHGRRIKFHQTDVGKIKATKRICENWMHLDGGKLYLFERAAAPLMAVGRNLLCAKWIEPYTGELRIYSFWLYYVCLNVRYLVYNNSMGEVCSPSATRESEIYKAGTRTGRLRVHCCPYARGNSSMLFVIWLDVGVCFGVFEVFFKCCATAVLKP